MRYAHLAPDFLGTEVAKMSFATTPPADVTNLDDERRKRGTDPDATWTTVGPNL